MSSYFKLNGGLFLDFASFSLTLNNSLFSSTISSTSFIRCHVSCVRCQVSVVGCQVSGVMCYFFRVFICFFHKAVELVGGGSVINGAYPSLVFLTL